MAASQDSVSEKPSEAAEETAAMRWERAMATRPFRRALRIGVLLPLGLFGFLRLDLPNSAFSFAFSLICLLVLADFSGPRRERAVSIVITGLAGVITLTIGAMCSFSTLLLVVMALVLGFAVTILGVLRGFVGSAAIPILLPFFLAATTDGAVTALPQMVLGWLVGTVVSVLAGVFFWPYFPRANIGHAVRSILAAESRAVSTFWNKDSTAEGRQTAVAEVDDRIQTLDRLYRGQLKRPGSAFRRERTLVRLIEEVRRLRLGLHLLHRGNRLDCYPADTALATLTADSLAHAGDQLGTNASDLTDFYALEETRAKHWDKIDADTTRLLAAGDAEAINRRVPAAFAARMLSILSLSAVRDAALVHAGPRTPVPSMTFRGIPVPGVIAVIDPWRQVRIQMNPSAPWFRNALRLGIALAVALLVVEFTGVERGYWVVLATLSVLRLDRAGTGHTAWDVLVGQVLGFATGGVLLLVLQPHPMWAWVTLPFVVGFLGYVAGNKGTVVTQAAFTTTIMNLLAITLPGGRGFPELRLLDAVLGLVVAVVVSLLVLPRGLVPQVEQSLIAASDACGRKLRAAISQLAAAVAGEPADPSVDSVNLSARTALERASETVDLALAQGSARGAQTLVWARVISLLEHVTYVAEVVSLQVSAYPGGIHARRAGGDLVAAADAIARRLAVNVRALLSLLETLPSDAVVPEAAMAASPLPDLVHARATIEAKVDKWAQHREANMAPTVSRLYWSLRWLEEIDLIVDNIACLTAKLRGEPPVAQQPPTLATA